MREIRTGAFRDKECTCQCGNKHELYGGLGYKTTYLNAHSDGNCGGLYNHKVSCNKCATESELKY